MPLYPEGRFVVSFIGDEINNQRPDGTVERMGFGEIRRVIVETNDTGPWGADVWWILEGATAQQRLCFPQGATGEDVILDRLSKLPGFGIRGMNSTRNAQFECWPNPAN